MANVVEAATGDIGSCENAPESLFVLKLDAGVVPPRINCIDDGLEYFAIVAAISLERKFDPFITFDYFINGILISDVLTPVYVSTGKSFYFSSFVE